MASASNHHQSREERVAEHSLQSAQSCLVKCNYGRAFAHYLLVLKLQPEKKPMIKRNFVLALREWTEHLERQNRLQDMFMCYHQACELFPDCETMLNNMGAQLFRLGYVDEAACCFRRALKIEPDFLGARENLDNVCSHLVERWHFRMLNDSVRNERYREAIHKAIKVGHHQVLDIGTGTGLLSLFAVEGGARQVYGCEMSKTMFEVSTDVVSANQMEDRIKLIHKPSTELLIPIDIPHRVSLVVTETFDAGLLGEHILATLHHAWQHLLMQPLTSLVIKPTVIPSAATIYVCGIESDDLRITNKLLYPGLRHLDLSNISLSCRTSTVENQNHSTKPSSFANQSLPQSRQLASNSMDQPCPSAPFSMSHMNSGTNSSDNPSPASLLATDALDAPPSSLDVNQPAEAVDHMARNAFTVPPSQATNSSDPVDLAPLTARNMNQSAQIDSSLNMNMPRTGNFTLNANNSNAIPNMYQTAESSQNGAVPPSEASSSSVYDYDDLPPPPLDERIDDSSYPPLVEHCLPQLDSLTIQNLTSSRTLSGADTDESSDSDTDTEGESGCEASFESDLSLTPPHLRLSKQLQQRDGEPYTSERLQDLPSGYRLLTDVHKYKVMDFNSQQSVESYIRGFGDQLELHVQQQGRLDALVLWFDLHLDSEVMLSSSPDSNSCWEQAVYPVHSNHFRKKEECQSHLVQKGDILNVSCSCHDNAFHLQCTDIHRMEEVPSEDILPSGENINQSKPAWSQAPPLPRQVFYLEPEDLHKLNDIDLNNVICDAIKSVQFQLQKHSFNLLYASNGGLSPIPLQGLKMGAQESCILGANPDHHELYCALAVSNGIEPFRLKMDTDDVQSLEREWDVYVTDLVNSDGTLHQQVLEDIAMARVTCLEPTSIVIPYSAKVYGMVIESQSLALDSAVVNNDHTLGFRIAEFMNDFQMTTHVNICLSTLNYNPLTEPFELFSFDFNEREIMEGLLPEYLQQSCSMQIKAVDTGRVTATVYWFEMFMSDKKHKVCTLNPKMHWRQAAVIQKSPIEVSTGSTLLLKTACKNSCIDINLSLLIP